MPVICAVAPKGGFAIVRAASNRFLGASMADHTGHGSGADFDYKEHVKTWLGFLKLIKWMLISSIILLAILLIWRTHN